MLFKTELIYKIVAGQKRQTRRPVKVGDVEKRRTMDNAIDCVKHNGRLKYQIGNDYAVQSKRGQPCMLYGLLPMLMPIPVGKCNDDPIRIRITNIRREDVRNISHADAVAEGFEDRFGFLAVWTGFYDKRMAFRRVADSVFPPDDPTFEYLREPGHYTDDLCLLSELLTRPAALYDAWALTFEVAL